MIAPDKVKIFRLFKYCQDAFRKAGVVIAFPADTPPEKTYKWRYLVNFALKVEELGASEEATIRIVEAVVQYAMTHKQLRKGLALLTNDQILEECTKIAAEAQGHQYGLLTKLESDLALFNSADASARNTPRGLPNIVRWYMRGEISRNFLAVSRKAGMAIDRLCGVERGMVPNYADLFHIRCKLYRNASLKCRIRAILGADFRTD